jgi:outer membrane beta-barrel protein
MKVKNLYSKVLKVSLLASMLFMMPVSATEPDVDYGIRKGSVEITPFAGFGISENKQNLKNRLIYGLRNGYNFTRHFAIEGVLEFMNTRVDDKTLSEPKPGRFMSPIEKVDVFFYHANAVYSFMPEKRFNPFVFAGMGGTHYSPAVSNQDMTTFDFGVGGKFWLGRNLALRLDVKDNFVTEVFKRSLDNQQNYHNIVLTVGAVFALGGEEKQNVYIDVKDKDTTPPFVTLTTPYDASIGVPLHRKIHVAFSEPIDNKTINSKTVELFQGESLKPVSGDVVALTSTSATFTQTDNLISNTTYVGKISTGVKDIAGNALAENFYWSFKTDSIPDVVTETKVIVIHKLVMLEDTHFKLNDATLTEEGKSALNTNISILKDNPDVKVRIAGYASASGTREYNQELSERRANTVRTYVIEKGGIKLDRLDVIGYGETRPAIYEPLPEELRSKAAKANMRVLFEVIVK